MNLAPGLDATAIALAGFFDESTTHDAPVCSAID